MDEISTPELSRLMEFESKRYTLKEESIIVIKKKIEETYTKDYIQTLLEVNQDLSKQDIADAEDYCNEIYKVLLNLLNNGKNVLGEPVSTYKGENCYKVNINKKHKYWPDLYLTKLEDNELGKYIGSLDIILLNCISNTNKLDYNKLLKYCTNTNMLKQTIMHELAHCDFYNTFKIVNGKLTPPPNEEDYYTNKNENNSFIKEVLLLTSDEFNAFMKNEINMMTVDDKLSLEQVFSNAVQKLVKSIKKHDTSMEKFFNQTLDRSKHKALMYIWSQAHDMFISNYKSWLYEYNKKRIMLGLDPVDIDI